MIDLHCHILPGLDDGPATMEDTLEMARVAVARGIEAVVATPHVREDHPFPLELIEERAGDVRRALAEIGVELEIIAGAEVAISKLPELDGETLRRLCLGGGPYILIESPYGYATGLLESALFDLQVLELQPVLAHPERSPSFQGNFPRLGQLVEQGILCSLTADSVSGRFGRTARKCALQLFADSLVHDLASDAHDAVHRQPDIGGCFSQLEHALPDSSSQVGWLTEAVPRAILDGRELPPRPQAPKPGGVRRLFRR